jgi:hypothetical protein
MITIKIKDETILHLIDAIQLPYQSEGKRDKNLIQSFISKVGKYEDLLNEMIEESLSKYPQNYNHATKQIKLPLYKIHQKSSKFQINGKRYYIHALFAKYAPIMSIQYNNKNVNARNEYSLVFFHPTAVDITGTMKTLSSIISDVYNEDGQVDDQQLYMLNGIKDDMELFNGLFPDIDMDNLVGSLDKYDWLRIDIKSLTNYIAWLGTADKLSIDKKMKLLSTSSVVLRVAKLFPYQHDYIEKDFGLFPMARAHKASGRIYYTGINVQNVEKNGLRIAMLGKHHEYDMRSCSIVWKYNIGRALLPENDLPVLSHTIQNKKQLYVDLANELFYDITHKMENKLATIKEIVTSIGFGARYTENRTYPVGNGKYKRAALYDAIYKKIPTNRDKCIEVYERCKSNWYFNALIQEHDIIEKALEKHVKKENPDFKKQDIFRGDGENNKYKRSKFIAHLYQSFETDVMNKVRDLVHEYNLKYNKIYGSNQINGPEIIANIHDAIITDRPIDLEYINYYLNEHFGYDHLELGHTIHDGWANVSNNEEYNRRLAEHHAIIARETAKAKGYISENFPISDIVVPTVYINPYDPEQQAQSALDLYWQRFDELESA